MRRLSTIFALAIAVPLYAQDPMIPASEITGYVRLLELQGKATGTPLVYWSSSTTPRQYGLTVDSAHLWSGRYTLAPRTEQPQQAALRWLDPQATFVYNTAYPRSANDGALWQGRGLSSIVSGGAEFRWGHLTARLFPSLVYSQNASFPLATGPGTTNSKYAYPWEGGIDFPQRFGTGPVTSIDPGQSEIRLDYGAFTVALSTENLWWGPAYRNPIIMSNAAPGFPHFDIGTGRPIHTRAGDIEFRLITGELTRSNYFGPDTTSGRRIFNGLTLGYRPSFMPGLTLGLTRVLYHEWPKSGLGIGDFDDTVGELFNSGHLNASGLTVNDNRDQLASVTARWVLPESGAEVYVEFARGDFAGSLRDLLLEPDHSRAYTIGFQKTLPASSGAYVLRVENTTLGQTQTLLLRGYEGGIYTHFIVTEGYTNAGQLLGAPIGPGSNNQYLGLDRYTAHGRYGVFLERTRYDDDYAWRALQTVPYGYLSQQTDFTLGLNMVRFSERFDWGGSLEITDELNRYFVQEHDVPNVKLSFNIGWHK